MKKGISFLLLIALLLTSTVSFAESTVDTGIWERRAYVDEFDLPTDEYYISNKEPIVGKFSNSATTDSELLVWLYLDAGLFRIKLLEYGDHVVKNSYSNTKTYSVAFMAPDESKYYWKGYMFSGSDTIAIDLYECIDGNFTTTYEDALIGVFCQDGPVRFAITEEDSPTTKYSFVIDDATGYRNFLNYTEVGGFDNAELAPVKKGGKWGYINTSGELVIACNYEYASEFSGGLAAVKENGKYGFIDSTGALIIPCTYGNAWSFTDGLSLIYQDGKAGYMDKNETVVIPCQYQQGVSFINGIAFVKLNDKWGCIDTNGEFIVPATYDSISYFGEDSFVVNQEGKYGIIDISGKVIIPCEMEYDFLSGLSEGFARAYLKNGDSLLGSYMWGIIDENACEVHPCDMDYQHISSFKNGLARVQEKNDYNYGYIDYYGNEIIPCQYQQAEDFSDGIARIRVDYDKDDKKVSYQGTSIWKPGYRYGFIDRNGNEIIPCEYLDASYSNGRFVLLNENGITVISRDEIQPNWKEELSMLEQELAEQAEGRRIEAEKQKMLKEYTDKETIKAAQTALNAAGYDCGKPDGIAGKGTAGAVTKCQTDMGLNVTGTITHELLIALGVITE